MKRLVHLRSGALVAITALLAIAFVGPATAQAEGTGGADTVLVDLRIWQNVSDPEDIWVSARPAGGDWDELGTSPLEFEDREGNWFAWFYWAYRSGDVGVAGVDVTVSQDLDEPRFVYASTCSYPPSCGLMLVSLDDGYNRSRTFRFGNITLAVPVPSEPQAEDQRLLLEDRDHLLALRDRLAGYERTLNWHPAVPMEHWMGVTVAGSPPRVTRLHLPDTDLNGQVSGLLGDLTALTELRLDGNRIDGSIPSKLLQLENLTHLYLGGNTWEGCIAPLLRSVPNNDLDVLGLPDCLPPPDITWGQHILLEGTYRVGKIVFDVPSGVRLALDGIVHADPGGTRYILKELATTAWIGITEDADTYRWTRNRLFDSIDESVWVVPGDVLALWQESEDDSSQEQPATATSPRQYPRLAVASDGSPDALILHWSGGPPAALKWQYRQGLWEGDNQRWGEWTDIPGSDSSTTSYRVDGLEAGRKHLFIVRAVETLEGLSSGWEEGETHSGTGVPVMTPEQVVVGDGVTEWRFPESDYVVTIPEGLRVKVPDWRRDLLTILGDSGRNDIAFKLEAGALVLHSYWTGMGDRAEELLEQIAPTLRRLPASAP